MTTIDAHGNRHATDSGRFTDKVNSRPLGAPALQTARANAGQVQAFLEDWEDFDGDDVSVVTERHDLPGVDTNAMLEAWQGYEYDVDGFFQAWADGDVCPVTQGGHDVSDGSCDQCGGKNFA